MPKIEDGPKELNDLLENVYAQCMKDKKNATRCSKTAWGAAENAGWHKNKQGKWIKKSASEIRHDELLKKGGIKSRIYSLGGE